MKSIVRFKVILNVFLIEEGPK